MPKALIIGAGIGGLAAGIALRQVGWDVEIFERSEELKDVGAGISLWANALHALAKLGLGNSLKSASCQYAIGGLRTSDGKTLVTVSMTELEQQVGVPIVMVHRADLLSMLHETLGNNRVQLGHRCIGIQQDQTGVTAQFDNRNTASADILIGADGLNSVVRAALHGDRPPRYAGCTAWRAVVPFDVSAVQATESWGRGSVFGQVPMSEDRVYWYATKNCPPGQCQSEHKPELRQLFRGWHAPIEELIEATPESAILRNDIFDRPPLKTWGRGRVTLLGDAAHPMTPYLGQGGCQALEDAVVLGQCLTTHPDIESALRAYESLRIPRVNALVQRSRVIGQIAQLKNPFAVRLRNFAFQFVTPRLQSRQLAAIVGHKV